MFNITNKINKSVPAGYELIWLQNQHKIVLFINGVPHSFINLSKNNAEDSIEKAVMLLEGQGTVIG